MAIVKSGAWIGQSGEHPDDIVIAAYLDGNLEGSARDALESHLAECSLCRDGVTLLAGAPESDERPPSEAIEKARALEPAGPASMTRFVLPAALAAGLLIAVAAGLWERGPQEPASPAPGVERSTDAAGLSALSPAAGARIAGHDIVFAWASVAGADRYVVTVSRVDGTATGTIEVRAPSASALWGGDRPALPPGGYLWSVRALSLDRVLDETRPVSFEVR